MPRKRLPRCRQIGSILLGRGDPQPGWRKVYQGTVVTKKGFLEAVVGLANGGGIGDPETRACRQAARITQLHGGDYVLVSGVDTLGEVRYELRFEGYAAR